MNRFLEEFDPESAQVAICGSISHKDRLTAVAAELRDLGYTVSTPEMSESSLDWSQLTDEDIAREKGRLVRRHFANIALADAVLVCNYEKHGIDGYIGANTLMEMAAAFAYEKPLYLLHKVPSQDSREEILAMEPIVLNDDLSKIEVE